jgi:hypothetical protein
MWWVRIKTPLKLDRCVDGIVRIIFVCTGFLWNLLRFYQQREYTAWKFIPKISCRGTREGEVGMRENENFRFPPSAVGQW